MFLGYFRKKRRFLFYLAGGFSSFIAFRRQPSFFRELSPGFYIHFILSAQLIAEWFATLSVKLFGLLRHALSWVLWFWVGVFTHSRFLLCAPSPHFDTFCDSDAGRNIPSRIALCACPHNVVSSSWCMVLIYLYCRYKTIGLPIAPVIVSNCFNETTF